MTTSVVIPVYNGQKFLEKNLKSVVNLQPTEIIIVDDASTDSSSKYISENFPQIKLIHHKHNQRFPKTVNHGVSEAVGDIIILLNQDVSPNPGLISQIREYFTNPEVFAVSFNEEDRSWAKASFSNGFLEYKNGPQDKPTHESFWASGGSAAFRSSHWRQLGGFDPIFTPGYFEDLDLGYRAQKRGLRIVWSSEAKVSHTPETSISSVFTKTQLDQIKERNYLLAQWKNLDASNLFKHKISLIKRIFRHPGFIVPVLKALIFLPNVILFRIKSYSQRKLTDSQVFSKFN